MVRLLAKVRHYEGATITEVRQGTEAEGYTIPVPTPGNQKQPLPQTRHTRALWDLPCHPGDVGNDCYVSMPPERQPRKQRSVTSALCPEPG